MALNWLWKNKCGTLKQMGRTWNANTETIEPKEFAYNLYEGNAYLIAIAEWEEDGKEMYSVHTFWLDEKGMDKYLANDDEYSRVTGLTLKTAKLQKKKLNAIKRMCKAHGIPIELTD